MTTLAVTGCAGYIGSYLVKDLLSKGYSVRGMDNFFKGHGDALFSVIGDPKFTFIKGDVTNPDDCKRLMDGSDGVLHLAALVGLPICKQWPKLAEMVNVEGTKNIIAARNGQNAKIPIIACMTGSQYGVVEGTCTEDSPQNTDTVYGLTKKAAEALLVVEKNTVCLRYATCFGVSVNMRINLLVNDFVNQAVNNRCISVFEPDARRTFIHISDFVHALEFSFLFYRSMKYNVFNAGDDSLNWTKRELAEYIKSKTGCVVFYGNFGKDEDKRDYSCSYKRLNQEGFVCKTSMEAGIDELIKAAKLLSMRNPYS